MNTPLVINLPLQSGYLWFAYGIFVLLYLIMSLVFLHHWKYYGVEGSSQIFAKGLYFMGGIVILVALAVCLGSYNYLP
jgi:hypothetical protein